MAGMPGMPGMTGMTGHLNQLRLSAMHNMVPGLDQHGASKWVRRNTSR
jgi:hypothetical protein